jgi:ligand-binding sensor domain-containing protein
MGKFGAIRGLACLLAFSAVLQAQQYVFRAFRQTEGLKNIDITSLTMGRFGFLWLGTENGVYRFLGSSFQHFGPEQGIGELDVLDVLADPDGTVWAGTEKNLYRWDGQRFLPAGREPIPIVGPRRMIVEDAHHLLIVQNGRLYRLEHDPEGRMLSFLPLFSDRLLASMPDLNRVTSLSVVREPRNGLRVWAGCGKGLCTWPVNESRDPDDSGVTEWGRNKGLAADSWADVILDRTGTLWAGGTTHVAVLRPGSARFADRSIPGSDSDTIYPHAPLIEDREGRVLAPTEVGLARWEGCVTNASVSSRCCTKDGSRPPEADLQE